MADMSLPALQRPLRNVLAAREKLRKDFEPKLQTTFAWLHPDFKHGPWVWPPVVFVVVMALAIFAATPAALSAYMPMPAGDARWWLPGLRFSLFVVGTAVSSIMVRYMGVWPMCSWTMCGWNLCTLRYLFGALGWATAQRVLTFPSILTNVVTVLVWYVAILPGILTMTPKGEKRKWVLQHLVFSPMLLVVHGFNLPFALGDYFADKVKLTSFDLWVGLMYSMLYLCFYLFVLDYVGAHFYFILSPRKKWAACSYALLLGLITWTWYYLGGTFA